jgi:hypothetical protein
LIQAKAYLREDLQKAIPEPSEPGTGPDNPTDGIIKGNPLNFDDFVKVRETMVV